MNEEQLANERAILLAHLGEPHAALEMRYLDAAEAGSTLGQAVYFAALVLLRKLDVIEVAHLEGLLRERKG